MILKDKLQQGFASATGVLLEIQRCIDSDSFLKRNSDLKFVIWSIEKIIRDLEWCKKIIKQQIEEIYIDPSL